MGRRTGGRKALVCRQRMYEERPVRLELGEARTERPKGRNRWVGSRHGVQGVQGVGGGGGGMRSTGLEPFEQRLVLVVILSLGLVHGFQEIIHSCAGVRRYTNRAQVLKTNKKNHTRALSVRARTRTRTHAQVLYKKKRSTRAHCQYGHMPHQPRLIHNVT